MELGSHEERWLRGRRFLVTGGLGRIGQALCRVLLERGAGRITVLDVCAASPPTQTGLVIVEANMAFASRPPELPEDVDYVFHLAAIASVAEAAANPAHAWAANVTGSVNMLEFARTIGCGILLASTVQVYAPGNSPPVNEKAPTSPQSIYAASKLAAEIAFRGYASEYGLDSRIARLANVYGGPPNSSTAWGRIVEAVARGEVPAMRSLDPLVDFLHRDDAVRGLVAAAAAPAEGEPCPVFNVGPGRSVSIGELLACAARSNDLDIGVDVRSGTGAPALIDISKIRRRTGWRPRVSVEEGIADCVGQRKAELLSAQ